MKIYSFGQKIFGTRISPTSELLGVVRVCLRCLQLLYEHEVHHGGAAADECYLSPRILRTKYHSPVVAADVHDHVLRLLVRVDGVQEEEGARHVLDVVLREESGTK